jgi:hypothetical protein
MKIGKALSFALVCAPMLEWAQAAGGHFDGTWTSNMSCDASTHMRAFRWSFVTTIANGDFHGQHGEEGGPGYLVIDGTIGADGSAKLHAKGTVQAGKAGFVTQLKGNKYDYYIDAKFTDASGTGKREEGAGILGRPCSFEFTKQTGADTTPVGSSTGAVTPSPA